MKYDKSDNADFGAEDSGHAISIVGTVIGAVGGFIVGGPIGAVIGGTMGLGGGLVYEGSKSENKSSPSPQPTPTPNGPVYPSPKFEPEAQPVVQSCQLTGDELTMFDRIMSSDEATLRQAGKSRAEILQELRDAANRVEGLNCSAIAQQLREKANTISRSVEPDSNVPSTPDEQPKQSGCNASEELLDRAKWVLAMSVIPISRAQMDPKEMDSLAARLDEAGCSEKASAMRAAAIILRMSPEHSNPFNPFPS